jgi:hypothetical protein
MILKIIQSRTRIWTRKNGKHFQKHENQWIRDNALILARALDLSTRCSFKLLFFRRYTARTLSSRTLRVKELVCTRPRVWCFHNSVANADFDEQKWYKFQKKRKQWIIDNALILARALDFLTRCASAPAVLPSLYGADPIEQNFPSCKIGMH